MIEINLLPLRWRVRRRKVAREAAVVALVTSVVLVGLAGWRFYLGGRLSELRQEMGAKEQEVRKLEPIARKVDELRRVKRDLKRRLKLLEDLRRTARVPCALLEELSVARPERAWLVSASLVDHTLVLEGRAWDNDAATEFLQNLERQPGFGEVEVLSVWEVREGDCRLKAFRVRTSWKTS